MSLMCQILTLNEAVEDLKFRRENHYRTQLDYSNSRDSLWSLSVDNCKKTDTTDELHRKYPSPSTLSLQSRISKCYDSEDVHSIPRRMFPSVSRRQLSKDSTNCVQREKVTLSKSRSRGYIETEFSSFDSPISVFVDDNSFDSGIDEPTTPLETSV